MVLMVSLLTVPLGLKSVCSLQPLLLTTMHISCCAKCCFQPESFHEDIRRAKQIACLMVQLGPEDATKRLESSNCLEARNKVAFVRKMLTRLKS